MEIDSWSASAVSQSSSHLGDGVLVVDRLTQDRAARFVLDSGDIVVGENPPALAVKLPDVSGIEVCRGIIPFPAAFTGLTDRIGALDGGAGLSGRWRPRGERVPNSAKLYRREQLGRHIRPTFGDPAALPWFGTNRVVGLRMQGVSSAEAAVTPSDAYLLARISQRGRCIGPLDLRKSN